AERGDRVGVQCHEEPPGRTRGAAATEARERGDRACERELGRERARHQGPPACSGAAAEPPACSSWRVSSGGGGPLNAESEGWVAGTSTVSADGTARTRT